MWQGRCQDRPCGGSGTRFAMRKQRLCAIALFASLAGVLSLGPPKAALAVAHSPAALGAAPSAGLPACSSAPAGMPYGTVLTPTTGTGRCVVPGPSSQAQPPISFPAYPSHANPPTPPPPPPAP